MLLDNKKNGKVGDTLRKHLSDGTKLSVISGLFSIYGFEALKKELKSVDSVRFLLYPAAVNDKTGPRFSSLAGDGYELRFKSQLNQRQIAKECARWLREKAEVRAAKNPTAFGQNLLLAQSTNGSSVGIQGSSHFTSTGLGYAESVAWLQLLTL